MERINFNIKDKDEPNDRQGAVYKIKCCDCQATCIGETGRNLNKRLTEHKRVTRNCDLNNNIAEHHLQTNDRIDWDSAECVICSTDYYQRLTLESWFSNLEQTPLFQFHFHGHLHRDEYQPKGLELVEKTNGTHLFLSDIPVGNFGLPLRTFRLFRKFSGRADQISL